MGAYSEWVVNQSFTVGNIISAIKKYKLCVNKNMDEYKVNVDTLYILVIATVVYRYLPLSSFLPCTKFFFN